MKKFLLIVRIITWVLLLARTGVLVGLSGIEHDRKPCRKVSITIDYGAADILITKKEIDSLITRTAGTVKGKPLGYINIAAVEGSIRRQSYVAEVKVFNSNDGDLSVQVRQREPLLRIINRKFESFYLDESGAMLPVNPNFSARAIVANGIIDYSYAKNPNYRVNVLSLSDSVMYDSLLTNLYKLAMYITHDKFLKVQIGEIYVDERGEFELIPRVGNHTILFGKAEDMDEKFKKLFAFYKLGLNRIGWNKYNVVNIKFKNQVVCSKI